jgi:hypothetical protein
LTNNQLIDRFNTYVLDQTPSPSRTRSLAGIHDEFNRRKIDYSTIGNKRNLSFKKKIGINENGIIFI